MKDSCYRSVCTALAQYFRVDPNQVKPYHYLKRDWGLDRLELQWISQQIVAAEGIEPRETADLEAAETIGHLIHILRARKQAWLMSLPS
jgi:hypothetical protein